MKTNQFRNKIVSYFVGSTLIVSMLYAIASFIFVYSVEDSFFEVLLKGEQVTIESQLATNQTPEPKLDFIRYYRSTNLLPEVIQTALANNAQITEVSGTGKKHYHLEYLNPGYLVAEVSEHLVVREMKQNILYSLLFILVIVIVIAFMTAIASYKLAKKLLKPLDSLMAVIQNAPVEKLPQNFAHQFKDDEIGTFAHTLEIALSRIRLFVSRERNFTRDVSHELRTPITISQGALTLLKQTNMTTQQQQLVARIDNAQQQIEESLQTLLALAREEPQGGEKSKLLNLVEQSVLQQYQFLADKDIAIEVKIAPQIEVKVAENALLILLNNVIGNAFKFTMQGRVDICYESNVLSISDTGCGISEPLHSRVMEAGIKGANSQGLGQGLNIVKRLCEQLDIELQLISTPQGTTANLIFPV